MSPELDLLVLGDANPDLVMRGDVEPAFGQTERLVDDAHLTVGGSGAIMACAAARLGLRVGLCAVVGKDIFGLWIRERLEARGVDVTAVRDDAVSPTGVTVVLSRGDDRAILTHPGAIAELRAEAIGPGLLRSARHLHVSSYFLQRKLAPDLPMLFDSVRELGGATSLDPNWDPSERWDGGLLGLLDTTDVLLANEAEAIAVAGKESVDEAAYALAARAGTVAIKLGLGGALARRGDEIARAPGIDVEVVDTTGAGDCFDAGFVYGLLHDWPLYRALSLANVCGGLSCRAAGGVEGQPTLEEALERLPD